MQDLTLPFLLAQHLSHRSFLCPHDMTRQLHSDHQGLVSVGSQLFSGSLLTL